MLNKKGYSLLKIDDVRIADENESNDNDIIVKKDSIKYTVQTFLNSKIGDKEIEETLEDMKKEEVSNGIIVTNLYVDSDIKKKAFLKDIIILDRYELENNN